MCISASASIKSFLVSVIACLMLVVFGRNEFKVYNWIIAAFFIYISLMQLVDLGMWIDLDCKSGTNKLASILGPIIHYIQPLMAFIILLALVESCWDLQVPSETISPAFP